MPFEAVSIFYILYYTFENIGIIAWGLICIWQDALTSKEHMSLVFTLLMINFLCMNAIDSIHLLILKEGDVPMNIEVKWNKKSKFVVLVNLKQFNQLYIGILCC